MAVANILSLAVYDNRAGQGDFSLRVGLKKIMDSLKAAGQVLFIAIQISQDIATGPPVTAINCVIHALIFFNEGFDALVAR